MTTKRTKASRGRSMPSIGRSHSQRCTPISLTSVMLFMLVFAALAVCSFTIWTSFNLKLKVNDHSNAYLLGELHEQQPGKSDAAKLEQPTPPFNALVKSRRYHEIPLKEFKNAKGTVLTAYSATTEIRRSSWFQPTKICKEACCAETVALSLHQDDFRIINTVDGLDLADIVIQQYHNPTQLEFFAPSLRLDMLPCLQPGTIVHIDNHRSLVNYFFDTVRPHVQVPYILMTSESDCNSPSKQPERLRTDDQLLKWYGQDADLNILDALTRKNATALSKLTAFPLGLSKHPPSSPLFSLYLQLNNYTNPFVGDEKQRWIEWANSASSAGKHDAEADNLLFVKFSIGTGKKHRRAVFEALCNSSSSSRLAKYKKDPVSCQDTATKNHETYASASRHLFGISPPGAGQDCYRTYELLMLGVIPIVQAKVLGSVGLFDGLPVIEVPNLLSSNRTREDYVTIMKDYIHSPAFQNTNFDGWERLFLKYWRRKLLKDTGRDKDIVRDEQGREYYQAWKYTTSKEPQNRIYCGDGVSCLTEKK